MSVVRAATPGRRVTAVITTKTIRFTLPGAGELLTPVFRHRRFAAKRILERERWRIVM